MEPICISGYLSLDAVLKCRRRTVFEIFLDEERYEKITSSGYHFPEKQQYKRIFDYSKRLNIPLKFVSKPDFACITKSTASGGIAAHVGEREQSQTIANSGFYLVFEGIEDPYNFGHLLRTAYAAGVDGVILPERDMNNATETIIRSSAGASEYLEMTTGDLTQAVWQLKENGFSIIATAKNQTAVDLYKTEFSLPLCLVIGGERRGISQKLLELADKTVQIPYKRDVDFALSASSAAAIAIFEIARQLNF